MPATNQSSSEESRNGRKEPGPVISTAATCEVKVGGKTLTRDIAQIELNSFVDDHHVLEVKVRETEKAFQERDIGDVQGQASYLGETLSLTLTTTDQQGGETGTMSFTGIVTGVNVESSVDELNVTTIRASSPTIAMDGARLNDFFFDKKPIDIVKELVQRYKITAGKFDDAGSQMRYCVQYRETDYDFVMRLATGVGLFAFYDGTEFRVAKADSTTTTDVTWRRDLGAFSMKLGTGQSKFAAQVFNYENKDPKQLGTSSSPQTSLSALSGTATKASDKIFTEKSFVPTSVPTADTKSFDQSLQQTQAGAWGRLVTCVGQSTVAAVKAGHRVKVVGMGGLEGVYLVTSVHHLLQEGGQYYNEFKCIPIDLAFPQGLSRRERATQIQSALVTDNNDPDGLGRVKVQFPWLDDKETPWVRVVVPHAGDSRGWYSLPEIGDEVVVGHENGDPDRPVILGSVYNAAGKPPSDTKSDKNETKLFLTKGGNQILLSDKSGSEKIAITTKNGDNQVVLDMSGPSISVQSKGDISIKGSGVTISADKEIVLKSGTNTKITASANLEAKASANFKAEGAMMDLAGQGPVNVKGAIIKLN